MFSKIGNRFEGRMVHYVDIGEITPQAEWSEEKVAKLKGKILKEGMLHPLKLSNSVDKVCLVGNQRLVILKSLGVKKVPVVYCNFSTNG